MFRPKSFVAEPSEKDLVRLLDPALPRGHPAGIRSGGLRVYTTIDPAFHNMPPDRGKVQLDQTGAFRGPISIDTTQLANGRHKLVVASSADNPDRGSTQSGVW